MGYQIEGESHVATTFCISEALPTRTLALSMPAGFGRVPDGEAMVPVEVVNLAAYCCWVTTVEK